MDRSSSHAYLFFNFCIVATAASTSREDIPLVDGTHHQHRDDGRFARRACLLPILGARTATIRSCHRRHVYSVMLLLLLLSLPLAVAAARCYVWDTPAWGRVFCRIKETPTGKRQTHHCMRFTYSTFLDGSFIHSAERGLVPSQFDYCNPRSVESIVVFSCPIHSWFSVLFLFLVLFS